MDSNGLVRKPTSFGGFQASGKTDQIADRVLTCPNPNCNSELFTESRFCPECGFPVTGTLDFSGYVESLIRDRINATIEERLKDTKVVEFETAEAIAKRVVGWAKLFAVVVGVPLSLLIITLALLGSFVPRSTWSSRSSIKSSSNPASRISPLLKKNIRASASCGTAKRRPPHSVEVHSDGNTSPNRSGQPGADLHLLLALVMT